ncbi:MAG: ABC transporter permease [Isosphaerales bacterium]
MRWGLGPVFIYECLTNSRRWQTYAARSFGVSALLLAMATIAWSNDAMLVGKSAREYANLGEAYFYGLIGVELALVMLAAPAATAGAICLDRSRGTLAHMLATDLSDPEIVLGKLAARLLPVIGLVACTWPVLSITSLLGGIDPLALTMAFAVIVAVALLGCCMALAISVWARKPHEVILVTYTFWILVLLIWPIWLGLSAGRLVPGPSPWVPVTNPFYLALAPYAVPGRTDFWDYLGFFAVALGASGAFTVVAVWRMRPVASRDTGENRKAVLGRLGRLIRRLPGPSLDGNPVLWREWHRARPSPWMIGLLVLLGGTTGIACVVGAVTIWVNGVEPLRSNPAMYTGIIGCVVQVLFGLLMLSAVAPMSMSEERQRGSLDVLAATPLSTRTIVLGKWWSTFRLVPLLAISPGLMTLALATAHKAPPPPWAIPWLNQELSLGYRLSGAVLLVATILAHGAAMTSVGLAAAIWIKRQSRAITVSVGLFVLVAVGWPILVKVVLRHSNNTLGLAALSPVWVAGELSAELSLPLDDFRGFLWWIALWDIIVVSTAIGLSWLAIHTFDRCFGRIPERARTSPLMADVLVLWGATAGAACFFIALTIWVRGVTSHSLNPDELGDVCVYMMVVALGLLLLSAVAPIGMPEERHGGSPDFLSATPVSGWMIAVKKWWRVFRLVPLLALGPGLIALALATAPPGKPAPTSTRVQTTLPSGAKAVKIVTRQEAAWIHGRPAWELPLGNRLSSAALLVMTIVAHGAATTSMGLALAAWIKRRSVAIAIGVCTFVSVAVAWPILVFVLLRDPMIVPGMSTLSPIAVAGFLVVSLMTREPQFPGLLGWATYSIVLVSLFAVGLLWMSRRSVASRFGEKCKTTTIPGPGSTIRKPVIEPLFAGD